MGSCYDIYLADSRMHEAIRNNDLRALRKAIKDGANVNARDVLDDSTPLFDACERNNIGAIRLLLDHGAAVNARNRYGETPFFRACEDGRMDIVRLLLEKGADVNIGNTFGHTPLHCVSRDRPRDPGLLVHLLVSHGANINAKDKDGDTPLHCACAIAYAKAIRFLLEIGAGPGVDNNFGLTPLDAAIDIPEDDPHREEIIDLFRQYAPELVMEAFCTQGPGEGR